MRRVIFSGAVLALGLVLLGGCAYSPRKILPETVLYRHAHDALLVENWKAATSQLRQLLSTYPFGKYATQARLDLIYAYYRNGQTDEASKQADEFEKENPASPFVPYALFLKAVAYANAMQRGPLDYVFHTNLHSRDPVDQEQAYSAFQQLVKRYPDSPYAKQAKQWMVFVRDRLAGFNLQVAQFYAQRRQWVAAVDRAATIVTKFPTTPAAKPALRLMIRGYRALGEDKLAAAAQRWYSYNFGAHAHTETASNGNGSE